jgi:cell division protease FtsH
MGTESGVAPLTPAAEASRELHTQWRRLARAATGVAVLTSPAVFVWLHNAVGWSVLWSVIATILLVAAYRGLVEVLLRRLIPWPSLFGVDDERTRAVDVLDRRRAWFWSRFYRRLAIFGSLFLTVILSVIVVRWIQGESTSVGGAASEAWNGIVAAFTSQQFWIQLVVLPLLFLVNFAILFGPLMLMGIMQIKGYEPGDADWGVRLDDVRGQAEAKEEVRRVVSLWQSGEAFERAGGKRERGLLFLGQPGTGKTMLAKAIATGFNSPFVSIPGSGFAQTFMGMDAVIVRFLARKAKKLARKWGGQCIVFIDEIDAVGMRRSSLGTGGEAGAMTTDTFHDHCFYGPNGALTPTGDLILETRAWRERLFAERAARPAPGFLRRFGPIVNQVVPGMMGGGMGQLALNQLLVVMDGIDDPPLSRRLPTKMVNTLLDAIWIVPNRIGRVPLRLPPPRPRTEQIYFIGATNVPIDSLDPALTRPGRLGRHVWLRTPTKQDRLDIFDLYLGKVDHEPDLDTDKRRDEIARVTNGYSPAMIEQVCSMALTYAHHSGRERFAWEDLVEATTTIESGMAINIEYIPEETRAVAIHEAGHAVAGHAYMKDPESTRLSIRRRGAALGHHQALEKEERFSSWRHEEIGRLIWTLGAMAAERVFYGENSTGVGGDVQSATARAAWMVGACAMGPDRSFANGRFDDETAEQTQERISKRFQALGKQIMNRTAGGGPFSQDPIASVLSDREQRDLVAEMLGQAYLAAYHLIERNQKAVEHIADVLVERREIHGDEVIALLDEAKLEVAEVDLRQEESWPRL